MSDKKKRRETFNMSDLEHSLLSSSPSLSAEDRAEIVNGLKNKRVEFLKEIQSQYDELEAKFSEERAALEVKYQKLYQPLYEKRFEIVNGVVEVECDSDETAPASAMDNTADDEKGVPDFWLTAMKSNEELAEAIQERDEAALKFLKDIKCRNMDNPKGFKLEFFFDTNPFFKNSVLTKTYHVIGDVKASIGTEIEWHPGKNLTRKILEKKPKRRSKNKKTTTRTEDCQSFFNFFSPPVLPDDVDLLDVETAQKLLYHIEDDYGIGAIIRDKIIPHAVSWFTGEGHSWR